MNKPTVAAINPIAVDLEEGKTYFFCTCGKSAGQPFCDGSHKGTSFTPKAFVAEKDGKAHLCQCKHSANAPFCDGSHMKLSKEQVGTEVELQASAPSEAMPEASATPEEPTVAFIHELARDGLGLARA